MVGIVNMSRTFHVKRNGIKYVSTVRSLPLTLRFVRKLFGKKTFVEADNWVEELKDCSTIIVFDSVASYDVICQRIESKVSKSVKLILFAWNPLYYSSAWKNVSKRWICCSFSLLDSKMANFNYLGTFFPMTELMTGDFCIQYDGYFVGIPKGRSLQLKHLKQMFVDNGLNLRVDLVDNLKSYFMKSYSKRIPYSKVIALVHQSRCIIEILEEGQTGPSLRCMEAMFFNKKLITNNKHIVDYDFYTSENVFILGQDDSNRLKEFLLTAPKPITREVQQKYEFDNWLNRILNL